MTRRALRAALIVFLSPIFLEGQAQQPPGGDQQAVGVRDRVVITGMVPIPDVGQGAPRFTSKDVEKLADSFRDSKFHSEHDYRVCYRRAPATTCNDNGSFAEANGLACEIEHARKAANLADKAATATKQAEAVRGDAAVGKASQATVEAAELKRQAAINAMEKEHRKLLDIRSNIAVWQEISMRGRQPDTTEMLIRSQEREKAGWGLGLATPDVPIGLSIVGVSAVQRSDAKGDVVVVSGTLRNSGDHPIDVPALAASLADDRGWPLSSTSVAPDGWHPKVPAGGDFPFSFEVRPAPQGLQNAIVTFASRFAPPPRMGMEAFCGEGTPFGRVPDPTR